jgi:hypothetical protein
MAYAAAPKLLKSGLEVSSEDGGPIINRERYINLLKDNGIDTPYFQQSLQYWRITRKFVVDYLACYYQRHADVPQDHELLAMLRQFTFQLQVITPDEALPEAADEDEDSSTISEARAETLYNRIVDVIANYIFLVTAGHEQVGTVQAYVQDVSFCAFKWMPGHLIGTKQTATAQALLMSFTATPMPKLLGSNWTHLFPPPTVTEGVTSPLTVFEAYQKDLQVFSDDCQHYNDTCSDRAFPYCYPLYTVDPQNLETSVSV